MNSRWALDLASTVRHDGSGGMADDLATVEGAGVWVSAHITPGASVPVVDEEFRERLVALRRAVRSLFARTVSPDPPSSADAHRLLPLEQALERLNTDAALVAVRPALVWPDAGSPAVEWEGEAVEPADAFLSALARAAIAFLAGPDRERLRSCPAPRCVRYFVQEHGRQRWCGTSCGNRARAARHYARHGGASRSEPRSESAT
ncbi:ABATE domain-containing protein [Nocardiopsis exhalans]|uniref:ABATE domain-containing protein n=1 Tax=Nocardiopsis exhalans TaxID=163604 RepID=A0ABY5D1X7_9ACTN|nr:CGNR zinc finger domain-containing protein [Nocardiopsis exhalans]USY17083.1 ABATE domain-containing protein [Nocardiopsis exhalans]